MVRPVVGLRRPTNKILTDSLTTEKRRRVTRRAGRRHTRAERRPAGGSHRPTAATSDGSGYLGATQLLQ
jgi:hypothetical protein